MNVKSLIGRSWSQLRKEAARYAQATPAHAYEKAVKWYASDAHEVRFFAVSVLGHLAGADERALNFLYERCGDDPAWQVNEGLAMAFDDYCAAVGYEHALPEIRRWLGSPRANVRRAVSEGLRPWTSKKRPYFEEHPEKAMALLGKLKDDESRYVQESVGNALRDIWRKHPQLVLAALKKWLAAKPGSKSRRIIAKFALKQAIKQDPKLERIYGDRLTKGAR